MMNEKHAYCTLPKKRLICPKNVGAQVPMEFSSNEQSAPIAIENVKILGAVMEIPAKQQNQFSPFTSKMGQMG